MSGDIFQGRARSLAGPAEKLAAVAPDDGADLPGGLTRGVFVGKGGDFVVTDAHGATMTFSSGDAQYHPLRVVRIHATGTTASGIVALY